MLTDTHCHFEDERYGDDRQEIIARNMSELAFAINATTEVKDFDAILSLTQSIPHLYAALGIHPHHSLRITPQEVQEVIDEKLKRPESNRVVAIGECGLDYYWNNQDLEGRTEYEVRTAQAELFQIQIDIARKNHLPIIIHCRDAVDGWDAYTDCHDPLENVPGIQGVIHSFSGNATLAEKFTSLGFYLGISGIVTFDKTGRIAEAVQQTPLEKLLLETDAPYLTPVPHRGQRNEPRYTKYVAEKIADIKNIDVEEVMRVTESNARKLFGIQVQ